MAAACPDGSCKDIKRFESGNKMNWYVVRTKPHQERLAELHLRQLTVETFLPLLKLEKSQRRQGKVIIEPLFPRYLFARFDILDRYRAVNFSKGVSNIVQFGGKPAQVGEELIDGIKSQMTDGHVTPKADDFSRGQIVHITGGPLAGIEAVFVKGLKERHRVLLLLRALGLNATINLDIEHVSLVAGAVGSNLS
jgi:transcriptional antiterminator RfaH